MFWGVLKQIVGMGGTYGLLQGCRGGMPGHLRGPRASQQVAGLDLVQLMLLSKRQLLLESGRSG